MSYPDLPGDRRPSLANGPGCRAGVARSGPRSLADGPNARNELWFSHRPVVASDLPEPAPTQRPFVTRHIGQIGSRRRQAAVVFIAITIDVLGFGVIIIPVLPRLVQQFMGDPVRGAAMYGLFGTVWPLMQFVFSPLLGTAGFSGSITSMAGLIGPIDFWPYVGGRRSQSMLTPGTAVMIV